MNIFNQMYKTRGDSVLGVLDSSVNLPKTTQRQLIVYKNLFPNNQYVPLRRKKEGGGKHEALTGNFEFMRLTKGTGFQAPSRTGGQESHWPLNRKDPLSLVQKRHGNTQPRGCFNLKDHIIYQEQSLNSVSRSLPGTFLVYTWLHFIKTEQTMFGIFALSY